MRGQGWVQGGWIGWLATPPPLQSFQLVVMRGNKTITEAILSPIVPISFCQVSHPPPSLPPSKILDPPLEV